MHGLLHHLYFVPWNDTIDFLSYMQYGDVFSFTMVGKTFTYLLGSDCSALFFNSKNQELNAEEVYSKLITPVFGKGVAYDAPYKVNDLYTLHSYYNTCMLCVIKMNCCHAIEASMVCFLIRCF